MTPDGMTILDRSLAELSRAFGDPVCRGDCCWWTISRERRQPIRLSVFIDGESDRAEGWLCDLQNPLGTTMRFTIRDAADLPPLIQTIRGLTSEAPEPQNAIADTPEPPPGGH